ncbi:MAG: hypothetical protein ACTSRA_01045 [Promethearchaeota archaeon]
MHKDQTPTHDTNYHAATGKHHKPERNIPIKSFTPNDEKLEVGLFFNLKIARSCMTIFHSFHENKPSDIVQIYM